VSQYVAHRPSIKGTKLLLTVIKAIIINSDPISSTTPAAAGIDNDIFFSFLSFLPVVGESLDQADGVHPTSHLGPKKLFFLSFLVQETFLSFFLGSSGENPIFKW